MADSFARLGYYNSEGEFVQTKFRAQDVVGTNGVSTEAHMANEAIHLTIEQADQIAGAIQNSAIGVSVASLVGGKVPVFQLPSQALTVANKSVATISDLLALSATDAPLNTIVFVNDASADSTVGSGWAIYVRIATDGNTLTDWTKTQEGEGLDVAMVDQNARDAAAAAQEAANTASAAADTAAAAATDAQTTANSASVAAGSAATEASALDASYITDESIIGTLNLRTGAILVVEVSNASIDA